VALELDGARLWDEVPLVTAEAGAAR